MVQFDVKKKYKFRTLAPVILGEEFNMMLLKGIIDPDTAYIYRDIYTLNTKLSSVINGLPVNANDSTYLLFENTDGEKVVFSRDWIDLDSVLVVDSANIRIDLPNYDTDDLEVIKNTLLEMGYSNINVYTY